MFTGRATHGMSVSGKSPDDVERRFEIMRFEGEDGSESFRITFYTKWPDVENERATVISLSAVGVELLQQVLWAAMHEMHNFKLDDQQATP